MYPSDHQEEITDESIKLKYIYVTVAFSDGQKVGCIQMPAAEIDTSLLGMKMSGRNGFIKKHQRINTL